VKPLGEETITTKELLIKPIPLSIFAGLVAGFLFSSEWKPYALLIGVGVHCLESFALYKGIGARFIGDNLIKFYFRGFCVVWCSLAILNASSAVIWVNWSNNPFITKFGAIAISIGIFFLLRLLFLKQKNVGAKEGEFLRGTKRRGAEGLASFKPNNNSIPSQTENIVPPPSFDD
jgi:hypothetical protein